MPAERSLCAARAGDTAHMDLGTLLGYLLAAGLLVALVIDGGSWLYWPIALLSTAGALALLTMANTMLVLMALATTMATAPALRLLLPEMVRAQKEDPSRPTMPAATGSERVAA